MVTTREEKERKRETLIGNEGQDFQVRDSLLFLFQLLLSLIMVPTQRELCFTTDDDGDDDEMKDPDSPRSSEREKEQVIFIIADSMSGTLSQERQHRSLRSIRKRHQARSGTFLSNGLDDSSDLHFLLLYTLAGIIRSEEQLTDSTYSQYGLSSII